MSFNKAKALKTASKYVQQGKYQSAIEEYRQIAQADPSDVTTLNTLGDLYVKVGQTSEAIQSFVHIAEHYRMSGFYLKAIAMLKKVSKLDPENIEVALKLAGLYAQQKLIVDARHQYLGVAERYVREGRTQEALHIYQKIADLDPENTAIQIKLAEAYLRENDTAKAYDSFLLAAGELKRQGKEPDALQAYLRAIKANPKGQSAISFTVNLYLQRQEHAEAIELLEGLLQDNPNEAETLTLISRVYQAQENLEAAESAMERMLGLDGSRYQYAVDLGLLYVRRDDVAGALRVFDKVAETLYEYREEEKAANLLREVLSVGPQNLDALGRLAQVYERSHDEHLWIETLNSMVDIALQQSQPDVAISALQQLRQLEPDEIRHRRRLQELQGTPEETESSFSSGYEFESDDNTTSVGWAQPDSYEPESAFAPNDAATTSTASPFEFGSNEEAADTGNQWGWNTADNEPSFAEAGTATTEYEGFGDAPADNQAVNLPVSSGGAPARTNANISDELESVDFYLSQGMLDVARYTLEGLAAQCPDHPQIAEKFAQLDVAEAQAVNNFLDTPGNENADAPVEDQATSEITNEVNEFTFSDAPGFDAVPEIENFNSDLFVPNTAPAPQEPLLPVDSSDNTFFGGYDVALGNLLTDAPSFTPSNEHDESSVILSGPPLFDKAQIEATPPAELDPSLAEQSWQPQTLVPTPANGAPLVPTNAPLDLLAGEEMSDLLGFLDDFKMESEQCEVTEDFETHFNLGLAYKEMDMFDEAIEEFQQAFKAVPDSLHPNYVSCCNMLGFCFMQKGLARMAVMWFKKALEVPGKGEEFYQALRYDLGEAYAAMGEMQSAYEAFAEVYAIDVQYRNVKSRLQEISAEMGK